MANEKTQTLVAKDLVVERIQGSKPAIVARLPKGIDPDKFLLSVLTAIQKSKATGTPGKTLADCDPNSVLMAAYDAAEVGCSLSPALALGWLIPYGKEAQFQPSYRFFIQKAYQTGEVKTFYAEVVYSCDLFERTFAPERNLLHAPGNGERSMKTAIGAYALIRYMDGTIDWEFLTTEQIDRHRNASKQPNSMKWTKFWEEGWRITPIRVLSKRLSLKSRTFEDFIARVNEDADRDLNIPVEQITEPSIPRRLADAAGAAPTPEKPAEQLTVGTEPEKEKPKEEPKSEAKPAETAPANSAPNGSMFNEEEDPYVTPAEMSDFWNKTLSANWKKSEVVEYIKNKFKVEALKDLRRSQVKSALDAITSSKP